MLHAEPASDRSARMPLLDRSTLLALYPGHSSLLSGTEVPQGTKAVQRRRQVWKNAMLAGMTCGSIEEALLESHVWPIYSSACGSAIALISSWISPSARNVVGLNSTADGMVVEDWVLTGRHECIHGLC